jgi:hypothetical protein
MMMVMIGCINPQKRLKAIARINFRSHIAIVERFVDGWRFRVREFRGRLPPRKSPLRRGRTGSPQIVHHLAGHEGRKLGGGNRSRTGPGQSRRGTGERNARLRKFVGVGDAAIRPQIRSKLRQKIEIRHWLGPRIKSCKTIEWKGTLREIEDRAEISRCQIRLVFRADEPR